MIRIAVVGNGKMGRAVHAAAERRGHEVRTVVTGEENAGGRALTRERLDGVEVAIEFTRPDAAVGNLERLADLGVPIVTGTTGWLADLPRVAARVRERDGALFHAANFSVGVHLLLRAARELARGLRGRPEFDANLVERHHVEKRDAPSGTALVIQQALQDIDPERAWPIVSIRAGWTPGTHTLEIDGRQESLTLMHAVRDRAAFAEGALTAAEWLVGRRGVFTFGDLLEGGPS